MAHTLNVTSQVKTETPDELVGRLRSDFDFEFIGDGKGELINEYYDNKIGDLAGHRESALKIGDAVLKGVDNVVRGIKNKGESLIRGIAPTLALRGAAAFIHRDKQIEFESVNEKQLIIVGMSRSGRNAISYNEFDASDILLKGFNTNDFFYANLDMGVATGGTISAMIIDQLVKGVELENIGVFAGVITETAIKRINSDVAKYIFSIEEGVKPKIAQGYVSNEALNKNLPQKEGVRVMMRALSLGRMPVEVFGEEYAESNKLYITEIMVNGEFVAKNSRDWGNEVWSKFEEAGESARTHIRYYLNYLRDMFEVNGQSLSNRIWSKLWRRHTSQAGIES